MGQFDLFGVAAPAHPRGDGASPAMDPARGDVADGPALPPAVEANGAAVSAPAEPAWEEDLLAVQLDQQLVEVTRAAREAGVRPGMRPAEARAVAAGLTILPLDRARLARAIAEGTALLAAASPQVMPVEDRPGAWWVDVTGTAALGGEAGVGVHLRRLAAVWRRDVRVGIADVAVAARAAALRCPPGQVVIVPSDATARTMAALPVAHLGAPAEMRQALAALGITTVGAFAALDPAAVEVRWGGQGLDLWRVAGGEDQTAAARARVDEVRTCVIDLGEGVVTVDAVLGPLDTALDQLLTGTQADGYDVVAVEVMLHLDHGRGVVGRGTPDVVRRTIRPAHPVRTAAALRPLVQHAMQGLVVAAPIIAVTGTVLEVQAADGAQGDLLAGRWSDPGAVQQLLDALQALSAAPRPVTVCQPAPCDDPRPEHHGAWVPLDGATGHTARRRHGGPAQADACGPALRLLDPPVALEVTSDAGTGEDMAVPARVRLEGQWHPVEERMGPDRYAGAWWETAYAADYWVVAAAGRQWLLVCAHASRSMPTPHWMLLGWYD